MQIKQINGDWIELGTTKTMSRFHLMFDNIDLTLATIQADWNCNDSVAILFPFDDMQVWFIPWSITHNVRELSGFFKDLRGTCLTRRLMALSLPGPDTLAAGIIPKRCRNIERSSLEGSVSNSHNQLPLKVRDRQLVHSQRAFVIPSVNFYV